MSQTFASSSRSVKNTCQRCHRTVYVSVIDGARVATDPELLAVVTAEGRARPERVLARRLHGELCDSYRLRDEKRAFDKALKKRARTRGM